MLKCMNVAFVGHSNDDDVIIAMMMMKIIAMFTLFLACVNAALTASKVMQVFSRSSGTGGPPKMLLAWSNKLAMEMIRRVSKKYLGF